LISFEWWKPANSKWMFGCTCTQASVSPYMQANAIFNSKLYIGTVQKIGRHLTSSSNQI
jgi:hypothetical protein